MAEAMAAWRSDTDRIMLAKMRVAAEASRQSDAAEETTRPIPVKLIAAALLGLTLISGGIYGYIDGSLGESLMSLMAPEEPAVPAAPLIADAPRSRRTHCGEGKPARKNPLAYLGGDAMF